MRHFQNPEIPEPRSSIIERVVPKKADPWPGEFCGTLVRVVPTQGYAFIGKHTIYADGIDIPPELMVHDLMLHVQENPGLGDPLPLEGIRILFRVRPGGSQRSGIQVYNATRA